MTGKDQEKKPYLRPLCTIKYFLLFSIDKHSMDFILIENESYLCSL